MKEIDRPFGVYPLGSLDPKAFEMLLINRHINWPRLACGRIDLSDEAFRVGTRAYPELRPLRELQTTLSAFNPISLAIGRDRRNRVPLRPFTSRTGRHQPSAKASLFGKRSMGSFYDQTKARDQSRSCGLGSAGVRDRGSIVR
jgi:hypothetical protein